MSQIEQLKEAIAPLREQLVHHPLYTSVTTAQNLKTFMQSHVYAVWDFMSLLKALQIKLTCTHLPWIPTGDGETRYLINEIVTGEESDVDESGFRKSHFELYLSAMNQFEANTTAVKKFINCIREGRSVSQALDMVKAPQYVKDFVNYTFRIIEKEPIHTIASVFTFGREDLIPGMFISFVKELHEQNPAQISIFKYYLERHIEVDGDEHSILGFQMVQRLCGEDNRKWEEAIKSAKEALQKRIDLWDGILNEIKKAK